MIKEASTDAVAKLKLDHLLRPGEDPTSPLVLLVHGRAGEKRVMFAFGRSIPRSCTVISPQAPVLDPLGGFSWWDVTAERERQKEQIEAAQETLIAFVEKALEHYQLKPNKILALGFSQGGALLSLLLQRGALKLSGLALLASFVLKREINPASPRIPIFMGHGSDDEMIPIDLAKIGRDYLQTNGFAVEWHEDDVGHKVGVTTIKALGKFSERILED